MSSRCSVVSSEDPNVNVFSTRTSDKVDTIDTHNVGVRAVSVSTNNAHVAIMDLDGYLVVHDVNPTTMKHERESGQFKGLISKEVARGAASCGFTMSWLISATGPSYLLVPGKSGAINVLSRVGGASWKESPLVGDRSSALSHHEADVNIVRASPNGAFIVSADVQGHVVVWKVDSSDPSKSVPIRSFNSEAQLRDVQWGRLATDNYLVLLHHTFSKLDDVVPPSEGHPATPAVVASAELVASEAMDISDDALMALENPAAVTAMATAPVPSSTPLKVSAVDANSDDEEFQDVGGKDKRKRLQKAADAKDDDDDDGFLLESAPVAAPAASTKRVSLFSADEAPKAVKDLFAEEAGETTAKELRQEMLREDDDLDNDDDDFDDDSMIVDKVAPRKKFSGDIMDIAKALEESGALASAVAASLQPAFQPSCTRPDEKNRRYLVWNSVGNITLREEALENRVEIRFTDASRGNRNEAFPDRHGFNKGALGYHGAAFATAADEPPKDELRDPLLELEHPNPLRNHKGSTLFYHAFPGSHHLEGVNENFNVVLSEGEEVQALAVGDGFVAAATSRRWLRIYSSTGLEVAVMSLPGPVVSMVALNETLAVIFHAGVPFDGSFNMAMHLFRIDWRQGCSLQQVLRSIPVPLSRKATLEWVGFDVDNTAVVALDSHGIMSSLMYSAGFQWTPVFNIMHVRKTIDHRYWPIMVKNGKLVYVLLNGESKPAIYPQPVVSTKALRIAIATNKDGTDFNEAAKEKMHGLLWEKMKTDHLSHEISEVMGKPERMEELQTLEAALETQQLASDKLVLAAFQEACSTQQIALALSLGLRLKTTKSLMAGIKVANHFGRAQVAEALDGMLQHRQALEMYQQQVQQAALVGGVAGGYEASQSQYGAMSGAYDSYQDAPEQDSPTGGVLSRKASLKQQYKQPAPSSSATDALKKVVSPDTYSQEVVEVKKADTAKPLNPFAVNKTGQTPQKRTASVLENLESPSPKKLNVSAARMYRRRSCD